MTQHELDRAVAFATGEALSEIRRRGFSVLEPVADFDPEPFDLPPQMVDWDQLDRERQASCDAPPRALRAA